MKPRRPASRAKKRNPFPVHHFLLALAPVLFLYSHNASKLPIAPSELILPLVASLAAALGLWLLFWLVMRSSRRAALVTSVLLVLFYLYGRVQATIGSKAPRLLLPAAAGVILLVAIIVFARPRREFRGLTIFANLVSLALVLINVVPSILISLSPHPCVSAFLQASSPHPGVSVGSDLPDIYYIILDSYAREDILSHDYGYDNSSFIGHLRSKGFLVGSRSRSNYAQTYLSLASSLNMTYLDSVAGRTGAASDDRALLLAMIADSRVERVLKQHGYTFVSFASGYTGTEFEDADVHFAPRWALSEFANVLISTTALPAILQLVARHSQWDAQRQIVLYALERLPDVARIRPPVFAFCHIIAPHPPFVFGPHGEKLNPSAVFTLNDADAVPVINHETMREDFIKSYRDQLQFVTAKVTQTIDRILARSTQQPIVILQGDHGPASFRNWDDLSPDQLVERMAILNACLIPPGSTGPAWYDSISPVNTFRLIFDRVFDDTLSLLPDRSWFSTFRQPYRFYDIDHPETYEQARSRQNAPLSVLVFAAGNSEPADPDRYARGLIRLRYPGADRLPAGVYFRPLPSDSLAITVAEQTYRRAVASGNLPDLGPEPDSYAGPGPDHRPVVALFFATGEQKQ